MPRPRNIFEENAYRAGAREEARLIHEGMTKSGEEIYEVVTTLAQMGGNAQTVATDIAHIYLTGLPFCERARIAYRLLRGRP